MKKLLGKLVRDEKGQALPAVLILLVVGALTIVPLLSHTTTGLQAGRIQEAEMDWLYAADAGVEDGLWRIKNEQTPLQPYDYETQFVYTLPTDINGKDVTITMKRIWPLQGLESNENGTTPPPALVIVGFVSDSDTGQYQVEMAYDGSHGDVGVDRVAVWLPAGYDYVSGSSSGITTGNPTIISWRGGKALEWNFQPAVNYEDLPTPTPPGQPGGFTQAIEYPVKRILNFNFSPVGNPTSTLPWIRTTHSDMYLSWDKCCEVYKVTSTATDAATGKQKTTGTYASREIESKPAPILRGNYQAIGNTLMQDTDHDYHGVRDILLDESSASVSEIPGDADLKGAYLYWSAWRERVWHWPYGYDPMEADTEVYFKVNDYQLYFDDFGEPAIGTEEITASRWWVLQNVYPDYSYSCFLDVTELVRLVSLTGNANYTVGNVSGDTGEEWSYAGWSLVLIYFSPSEDARQLYLYDGFLFAGGNTSHTFTIGGFRAPSDDAEAKLTLFVGEGDQCYTGDYIKFNGYYLYGGINPKTNVWNGKSSGLDGLFIDGVDIDTFEVSSPIINGGDTSATVYLKTQTDNWNLCYLMLSFRDVPGGNRPDRVGTITYTYGGGS